MKILIVEDDFVNRLILQKILDPFGKCDIAVNGREAVSACELALQEGSNYDLICLDIMMPEMDGREALRLIREMEKANGILPAQEAKIIMITALDTPKDVIEAFYKGGCTSYQVKPVEKRKLLDLLKELELI